MRNRTGSEQFTEKDQAYMKKYIESHSDNRMAWYLLGKQYERAGEMSKAHYCFNQAGDIYKAFENSPLPQEIVEERQENRQQVLQEKERKRHRAGMVNRALLLIIIAALLSSLSGDQDDFLATDVATQQEQHDKVTPSLVWSQPELQRIRLSHEEEASLASALLSAVRQTADSDQASYVVSQPQMGEWLIWSHDLKPWYAVNPSSKSGESDVLALNEKSCDCDGEREHTRKISKEWAIGEERSLLAKSIVVATLRSGIRPLPSISELAGAYPNNRVAGIDKELVPNYEQAVDMWKRKGSMLDEQQASQALFAGDENASSPFQEPMRIIVDKETLRLAVVSGNQLVRNYKVGLGGSRTPEGEFMISEKVVNPNGRSNGTFGSRGMTLSDTLYAIHGTNEPDSIGKNESLGCVRMSVADVEELFDLVPIGTLVEITNGVLPDFDVVPADEDRYHLPLMKGQTNPNKIYKWL